MTVVLAVGVYVSSAGSSVPLSSCFDGSTMLLLPGARAFPPVENLKFHEVPLGPSSAVASTEKPATAITAATAAIKNLRTSLTPPVVCSTRWNIRVRETETARRGIASTLQGK